MGEIPESPAFIPSGVGDVVLTSSLELASTILFPYAGGGAT